MSTSVIPTDSSRPPWSLTLGEFLRQVVSENADKEYLYYCDQRVTYRELWRNSLKAAQLFRELGVSKGERVCLFLPNCPEFIYCWFGLSLVGAILVPINTAYKVQEASDIVNQTGARILLGHHHLMTVIREVNEKCPTLERILVLGAEGGPSAECEDFAALLSRSMPLEAAVEISPTDVSALIMTSGTTGKPKGVMITHEMYVAVGQGFAMWIKASPQDRFFTCLPYFHANTHYYSTMGSLAAGASLVVFDRFSASRFWSQVSQSRATVVNFIGMMLPVLMKQRRTEGEEDHRVRLFYGAPAFPPEMVSEFESRFRARVQVGFAMTEAPFGTVEPFDLPRRAGSSGTPRQHPDPRFHNEVRIVDENGMLLPPRSVGEIVIRNPVLTPGYWDDETRTKEALRDGCLHTGDMAWMDEEGYLYFADRKKDIIRRRGENISSREVEQVLKLHPAVLECAVFAVPAELGEDDIKAVIVKSQPELKPEELIEWCSQRLAYFKVPRYVEFRSELPMTPSFRVRKDLLRHESHPTEGCFDREQVGLKIR